MSEGRGRRWFVALAWVTLVLFGAFVALITLAAACLPTLRDSKAYQELRPPRTVESDGCEDH